MVFDELSENLKQNGGYCIVDAEKHFIIVIDVDELDENNTRSGGVMKKITPECMMEDNSARYHRSGVYLYLKAVDDKASIYIGQATCLEKRALSKVRIYDKKDENKKKLDYVIMITNKEEPVFDESQIQHLEHLFYQQIEGYCGKNGGVRWNVQKVTPSLTTIERKVDLKDWCKSVLKSLKGIEVPGFDEDYAIPIFENYVDINIKVDNSTQFYDAEAKYCLDTKRVIIEKGGHASKNRWEVSLSNQAIKSHLIQSIVLSKDTNKGKKIKDKNEQFAYKINEPISCFGITEATAIIANKPQGSNAWKVKSSGKSLKAHLKEICKP